MPITEQPNPNHLYCPRCNKLVDKPLQCGDCLALICRTCGTPLAEPDDLALG